MLNNPYQNPTDVVCFSHLRWNFVFQRPQHLMSRFANARRVFFVEEPLFESSTQPHLASTCCPTTGVNAVVPHLPPAMREDLGAPSLVGRLLEEFLKSQNVVKPIAWFYSPMWLESYPTRIDPCMVLYDCMDELSTFKGACERLPLLEKRLMNMADLVFTGGVSLFEAKRSMHRAIHPFPSGVDLAHFSRARALVDEPADQQHIPRPRIGFAGVIDERIDYDLLRQAAALRPDWQFIMVGPVVKVDPLGLPQASNIHWLGMKNYIDLPAYFAHWDCAMMPFALNDATRFISPTKTPEFLAAGLPVVSTPIRDVVRPYGELGLARIASNPEEFVQACADSMAYCMGMKWRERADAFLDTMSWDSVWSSMNRLISEGLVSKQLPGRKPQRSVTAAGAEAVHV